MNAQYIDTKWTVTGYFGELWYAEEEDILGKQQAFFKGWADGVFYSCDYAGVQKVNLEGSGWDRISEDNRYPRSGNLFVGEAAPFQSIKEGAHPSMGSDPSLGIVRFHSKVPLDTEQISPGS